MKNTVKSLLVAAAVTGMLGATVVPVAVADDKPATSQEQKDKNSCKSANGCSGKTAAKNTKAKKTSKDKTKAGDSASTSKDKNSCKSANGCKS